MVEYDLRHHYHTRKRGRDLTNSDLRSKPKRTRLHDLEKPLEAIGLTEEAHLVEEVADIVDEAEEWYEEITNPVPSTADNQTSTNQGLVGAVSSGRRQVNFSRVGRMSRRRAFRGRRRFRKRNFKGRVKSVILSMKEGQRNLDSVAQATFTCGDGTTRVLYIASPLHSISTGSDGNQMAGNEIWLKGIWLRGRIALDQTTNTLKVRVMLLKTRQFADLPNVGFNVYGNTTTALTNPTQVAEDGESNIRIFETSPAEFAGQPSADYVGNASGIDLIDTDFVTVLRAKEYWMSPDKTLPFRDVDMYVPINRRWKKYSQVDEGELDQVRTFKGWNYYITLQVFSNSNANNILAAQDILGTFDIIAYFKEL